MRLSVIIKTLNEERNIARAVESSLEAVAGAGGGEVIVADSLSTDATVEIASRYPIRIVQLADPADRCCGVGAQLGFEIARGQYVYILDGDMRFEEGFLAAAADLLDAEPRVAGVGGLVREMHTVNEEFANRAARTLKHMAAGDVDRLDGGGLYRRSAIEQVGYFTNQNLHAFEEFELAARLVCAGWRLHRLDRPGVQHYGHTETSYRLLVRRWRSRYAWGAGELLREAWGRPHLAYVLRRLRGYRVYGTTLVWLITVTGLALSGVFLPRGDVLWVALLVFLVPFVVMSWRRGSVRRGVYAVCAWAVYAAGLVAGVLRARRRDPAASVHKVQLR